VSVSGGGQTFSAGLISTGDRAFVNFQGTNYEVGQATMAQLQQAAASGGTSGTRSLKQFGVDPLNWIKDASKQGDANVAGVSTQHVSAGIDIAKLFTDLNKVVSRAGGAVGAARPQQLTPQVIDQIKKVVHDPKFDVYVGKSDNKIRRAALSLQFTVPQQAQASARGVTGGNVSLSVELARRSPRPRMPGRSRSSPSSSRDSEARSARRVASAARAAHRAAGRREPRAASRGRRAAAGSHRRRRSSSATRSA
jgi:hypothetical protein